MGSAVAGEAAIIRGRAYTGIDKDRRSFDKACARIERAWAKVQEGGA
jgi:hypothetical protein